jgi:hypothetical protein
MQCKSTNIPSLVDAIATLASHLPEEAKIAVHLRYVAVLITHLCIHFLHGAKIAVQ